MNQRMISSLITGALLLLSCGTLMAREPNHNLCRALKNNLDNRVNNMHRLQNAELDQCRQTNGRNSDVCRNLKTQQGLELNRLRDDRKMQLGSCNPLGTDVIQADDVSEKYHYRNSGTDCYPKNEYPKKPEKPYQPKNPHDPAVAKNPAKNPSGNPPRDGNRGNTQSASSSANHNSGSSASSSRSSSSSSAPSPSSTSSNSYSPSSNPPPAPSYSPPSYSPAPAASTPSHADTGSARPR